MKILEDVVKESAVLSAPFVIEMMETTHNMWRLGWDERNGGNISYLLKEKEVENYLNTNVVLQEFPIDYPVAELAGKYFIVTGSGKYFKNVRSNPAECLGIVRVHPDGDRVELLWGLTGDGRPTSELATHFMSHMVRLKQDPDHRVIMHTHATNLIAMTFTHELNEKALTKTLWKMCTECVVVFPEGVGIVPWMVPGTSLIGEKTAEKMIDHRLTLWAHHGIFGSGQTLDDAFGLIETAEKAAEVYTLVSSHKNGMARTITDDQLRELATAFDVTPNPIYL